MPKKGLGGVPHGQRMKTSVNTSLFAQDILEDSDDDYITPGPGAY